MNIENMLQAANGKRRERILSIKDVRNLIDAVAKCGPATWHYISGGSVVSSYGYRAYTTLALVYKDVNNDIYVGVGLSDAISPSPGRVWKCLQPYNVGGLPTILRKLETWKAESDVICITRELING